MSQSFVLPPNWYRATATRLVETELPPLLGPLTAETAWRYVYACVMWYQARDGASYLHLNDQLKTKAGKELAERGNVFLADHLVPGRRCNPDAIVDRIGVKYQQERVRQGLTASEKRDPNTTGNAFEAVLQVLIDKLCDVLPSRTPNLNTLRGFELAPVGYHARPDLVLFGPRDFRMLISTKWTLRKERIGTYLHEAYFYKQRRPDVQVAFVVSEFNTNILRWLCEDPLTDRVYHVNRQMLLSLRQPFSQLADTGSVPKGQLLDVDDRAVRDYYRWLGLHARLFDLRDLFADISRLQRLPERVPDPEQATARSDDEVQ